MKVPKEVHQAARPPGHHAEQSRVVAVSDANPVTLPRRIIFYADDVAELWKVK